MHAGAEGLKFGYQLLYLLEASPYYSPALHLLRQRVVRVSGADLVRRRPRARGPGKPEPAACMQSTVGGGCTSAGGTADPRRSSQRVAWRFSTSGFGLGLNCTHLASPALWRVQVARARERYVCHDLD